MGREIVRQAQAEGEEIRRGADDYASEVLVALEGEIVRTLKSIKLGLGLLDERRAVAEPPIGLDGQGESDEYTSADEQPVRD